MSKELESLTTNTAVRKTGGVQRIQSTADKIRALHEGIAQGLRNTVSDAILIGELLTAEKKKLPHGQFQIWFKESELPFSDRTARVYMHLFRRRAEVVRKLEADEKLGVSDVLRLLNDSGEGAQDKASPGSLFMRLRDAGLKSLTKPEREQVKEYLKSTLARIDERRKELKGYYDKL